MSQNYGWDEIARHNTEKSCWVVLYGKVLDVTAFLNIHPGGLDPINDMGGQDITSMFETIGHSAKARSISEKYAIGVLDKNSKPPVIKRKEGGAAVKPLNKFTVEDDPQVRNMKLGAIAFVLLLLVLYFFS